jgi:PAN domain-containing protein
MGRKTSKAWGLTIAIAAALPAMAPAQRLTEEPGINRKGSDYTHFSTSQHGECRDACERDRRCRAYTFNSVYSECYLKDGVPGQSQDSRTVSGVKEGYGHDRPEYGDFSEEQGVNRKGSDYTQFRTSEARECRQACARDRRCRSYTYNFRDELCYLKDRVPSQSRDSRTVSGVKGGSRPDGGYGGGRVSEEPGVDLKGGDYTSFTSRGLDDCKDQCRRDNRCIAYTFAVRSGTCYLKDRIGRRESDRDKVSGTREGS